MSATQVVSWIAAIVAAVVLLQTLFFKFTGAAESVAIFTTLGVEPWGRILTGILELIAAVLLLVPRTRPIGAVIALVVMLGAISAHVVKLGVGGEQVFLFMLACLVLICSLILLYIHRAALFGFLRSTS